MARTSSNRTFCGSWRCVGSTSATRHATLGPICSWAGGDAPSWSRGVWAHETHQAASKGRGTHSQSDSRWLECWGALGFRGSGLHSNTAPSHQSRRGQSHLSAQPRPQRRWPTPRQPGRRTSIRPFVITDNGSLGRHARLRHYAGRAARLFGQAQPPQEAVVLRHGRSGHPRAHATAAGLERTVRKASHHTQRHEDRPLGSGGKTVGFWVDQASLMWSDSSAHLNNSKGSTFLGSRQAAHGFWQAGGVVTLAAHRAGQAGVAWHLDAGAACVAQGRGRRQLTLLRVPGLADSGTCKGCMFSGPIIQGTSRQLLLGQYRATCCRGRSCAMARTSPWTRSRCTSTAKVPSRPSMGQSAKPWALGIPEHASGAGFWFPSTRSRQSRSSATPHSATWRRGALPTCSKGGNDCADTFARKETDTHRPASRVAKTVVACASLAKQAARWAAERAVRPAKESDCSGSRVERVMTRSEDRTKWRKTR